jgi:hypothetical protein
MRQIVELAPGRAVGGRPCRRRCQNEWPTMPPPMPPQKKPRRTAERILEVTLDLFNRFGEPNVSTTLISPS